MSGFQPARLDIDPSIMDNKLSIVDSEDEMESMFKQMSASNRPKIESLVPEVDYPSLVVYPKPGLCVKTRNAGGKKFFINLCVLDEIPPPTPITEQELERMISEEDYTNLWRVPMSIDAPRESKDKSGGACLSADVALNADWFKDCLEPSLVFTTFVITVAMEGLCDKHGEQARLDRDSWTILKNKKYLGDKIPPHRIQKRASTGIADLKKSSAKITEIDNQQPKPRDIQTTPRYKIEKNSVTDPTELTACVHLPGINNINQINLEIGEDRLVLSTTRKNYHLDIFLPFDLDQDSVSAAFDPSTNILSISVNIKT